MRVLATTSCLVFVVGCGGRQPSGPPAESDAASEGATPSDASEASADGTVANADATGDGATSESSTDAGGALEDASADAPDAATDDATSGPLDADVDASVGDATPIGPIGPCHSITEQHPIEGFLHVPVCSHVTYLTMPPSSGDHYPIWAAYRSYVSAIPEGFWVHNLEHGTVVVSYNCPGGCASDVATAQAWIDGMPADPVCNPDAGEARIRVVMTPDPNLDVKFAASSWGWTLRADCFDPVAFGAFVQAHYGQGREAICAQGLDLSSGVQEGCGD